MEMEYENNLSLYSEKKLRDLKLLFKEKKAEHIKVLMEESQSLNLKHEVEKCEIIKRKENFEALHLKIQKIQEDVIVSNTILKNMDQDLKKMKNEIEDRHKEIKVKLKNKKLLQDKLSVIQAKIEEEEKNFLCNQDKTQKKIEQATNCVQLFKEYLGIRFIKGSKGSLIIIFTQVKSSNPDKEFMIELAIERDEYRVLRSLPPVHNLENINNNLNSAHNFGAFLIYMRGVFEKL